MLHDIIANNSDRFGLTNETRFVVDVKFVAVNAGTNIAAVCVLTDLLAAGRSLDTLVYVYKTRRMLKVPLQQLCIHDSTARLYSTRTTFATYII